MAVLSLKCYYGCSVGAIWFSYGQEASPDLLVDRNRCVVDEVYLGAVSLSLVWILHMLTCC